MTYPTDEMVEAAAEALHNLERPPADWGDTWNELADSARKPWLDKALAALTAVGPVLDREVVSEVVRQAYLDGQQAGLHGCCTIDVDRWKQRTDAILASAMTREQVERETLERLIAEAESAHQDDPGATLSHYELADWLRSQLDQG